MTLTAVRHTGIEIRRALGRRGDTGRPTWVPDPKNTPEPAAPGEPVRVNLHRNSELTLTAQQTREILGALKNDARRAGRELMGRLVLALDLGTYAQARRALARKDAAPRVLVVTRGEVNTFISALERDGSGGSLTLADYLTVLLEQDALPAA